MRVFILVLVVVLSFSVVSCANKENSNSGTSTTDPVSTANTTEPMSETAANTAKETAETSRLDGIEQKYLDKLYWATQERGKQFAEKLENAASNDLFEVDIDFSYRVDKAAAESYAVENSNGDVDLQQKLNNDYIEDYYVPKGEAFLDKYDLELTEGAHISLYSAYIGKMSLTADQILEIIQDDDVAYVSWHFDDQPQEMFD